MVVLDGRRFLLWKDRSVFFPSPEFLSACGDDLAFNEVVRISQTSVDLPGDPNILRRKLARTTCLDLNSGADSLYRQMDAKSCRYEIRRAERMADRISIRTNDASAQDDFLAIYNRFVAAKGYARPLSLRRLRQFLEVCDVFVIYLDGRPICGHVLVRDEEVLRARLAFSASCRLDSPGQAALSGSLNRYLHWHEIRTYQDQGFQLFDFGGIEDGTTPIAKFKLSFGGFQLVEHCYVLAGAGALLAYRLYSQLVKYRPTGFRRKRGLV